MKNFFSLKSKLSQFIFFNKFLNEKIVSKNSVAFGGNAELLNIQEEK